MTNKVAENLKNTLWITILSVCILMLIAVTYKYFRHALPNSFWDTLGATAVGAGIVTLLNIHHQRQQDKANREWQEERDDYLLNKQLEQQRKEAWLNMQLKTLDRFDALLENSKINIYDHHFTNTVSFDSFASYGGDILDNRKKLHHLIKNEISLFFKDINNSIFLEFLKIIAVIDDMSTEPYRTYLYNISIRQKANVPDRIIESGAPKDIHYINFEFIYSKISNIMRHNLLKNPYSTPRFLRTSTSLVTYMISSSQCSFAIRDKTLIELTINETGIVKNSVLGLSSEDVIKLLKIIDNDIKHPPTSLLPR